MKTFETLDPLPAAFLVTKGYLPEIVDRNNLLVYCFQESPELIRALAAYHSGAQVDVLRFSSAIKLVRGMLYSSRQAKARG